MSSLAWGRQTTASGQAEEGQAEAGRQVNVIASGCWDYVHYSSFLWLRDFANTSLVPQSVKIWKP